MLHALHVPSFRSGRAVRSGRADRTVTRHLLRTGSYQVTPPDPTAPYGRSTAAGPRPTGPPKTPEGSVCAQVRPQANRQRGSSLFERLFRLYDELHFEIQRVIVSGRPWNIVVGVEWLGHARPKAGEPYVNEGFHVINIRRGKVVYCHAYEDSQKVADACRQMADAGIEEAAAAPIVD